MELIYGKVNPPTALNISRSGHVGAALHAHWDGVLPGIEMVFDTKTSPQELLALQKDWIEIMEDTDAPDLQMVKLAYEGCKWPVMSMLQKAVRRSREDWALTAASALINSGMASTMWRRMAVICLEDLGLGGLPALLLVTSILNSELTLNPETEYEVAFTIIRMMIHAHKDRGACDTASLQLTKSIRWLEAVDDVPNDIDTNAALLLDRSAPLSARLISHALLWRKAKGREALGQAYKVMELPKMVQSCMVGYKSIHKDPMWVGLPMLWDMADMAEVSYETHELDEQPMIHGTPSCTFDMFTSDGKRAMAYFRKACQPVSNLIAHVDEWQDKLSFAVFAAEGGRLDRTVAYDSRNELAIETLVDEFDSVGMDVSFAAELTEAVSENLGQLHYARQKVVKDPVIVEA